MRKISVNVCKFEELSPAAKQRAKDDYARYEPYMHSDEALDSLKKLAEYFGGKLSNYCIDWFDSSPSDASFKMPDDLEEEEIKRRLDNLGGYNPDTLMGNGECLLTGVCTDENAIDGFRKAWHAGERDLDKLMQAAFKQWLKDCQEDCNWFYEDENFAEHCEANEYEFYEDGKMFVKGKHRD